MPTVEDTKAKEDLETLIVKNDILTELAGEVLELISETRTLIMDEYERIHMENMMKHNEEIEQAHKKYAHVYEKNRFVFQSEGEKVHKSILEQLESMIESRKELMVLNGKEKEARKTTDNIFEVVRNWTNIDFMFSQLLGMREALKTVGNQNTSEHQVALVNKIKSRMMSRVGVIQELHDSNKEMLDVILKSIEEYLDFVELGMDNSDRTKIVFVLNSIKNIPFLTLKGEQLIDEAIHDIQETMLEIRDQLFQLPLCQLRPRNSVRQTLWDVIDFVYAFDTTSKSLNDSIFKRDDLEFDIGSFLGGGKDPKFDFSSIFKSGFFDDSENCQPENLAFS